MEQVPTKDYECPLGKVKMLDGQVDFLFKPQGVFFSLGLRPPLKKTKSIIVLEYPDWASPGPHKKS